MLEVLQERRGDGNKTGRKGGKRSSTEMGRKGEHGVGKSERWRRDSRRSSRWEPGVSGNDLRMREND